MLPLCGGDSGIGFLCEAPLLFQQIHDPAVGFGGVFIVAHDLVDVRDAHERVPVSGALGVFGEGALINVDGLFIIRLGGIVA